MLYLSLSLSFSSYSSRSPSLAISLCYVLRRLLAGIQFTIKTPKPYQEREGERERKSQKDDIDCDITNAVKKQLKAE
jgi:hypothetical protein